MAIFKNRKSTSYVVTLEVNNSEDMGILDLIREAISRQNLASDNAKRVCVRGRKPKTKMEVRNFWTGQRAVRGYDFGGNCVGGLANATVYDVYIYDRS